MVVKLPEQFRALWKFAETLHCGNTKGRRSVVLYESARHTWLLIRIFFSSYLCALFAFGSYPFYGLIFKNEYILFLNLFIPSVNAQNTRGYLATMVFQTIIAVYAVFGGTSFDLMLAIFVSNYDAVISIWECQLKDLAEINRRKNTPKNRAYRRAFQRNVYIQLLDVIELE